MTATFLLVRHAAHVDLNEFLSGRSAGRALSDSGREQAAGLARALRHRGLAGIQTSPLERALQTASSLAEGTGLKVETIAALNEIDFGDWTGRASPTWPESNGTHGTATVRASACLAARPWSKRRHG